MYFYSLLTVLCCPQSQNEEMLGRSPEDVATFLYKTEGLNKTLIGDYLGEREDFNLKVMHAYVDSLDFEDFEFDGAIRKFLQVGNSRAYGSCVWAAVCQRLGVLALGFFATNLYLDEFLCFTCTTTAFKESLD